MADATKRYAVVTGANKGIGFETVRQLASVGINVVLTARDEKRGLEALERLKDVSELVTFHQLDVSDSASVVSLSYFIKSHFGKLDILVNNAGILGITEDVDAAKASAYGGVIITTRQDRRFAQTYELAEECLQINYYGAKRTAKSLLPLLRLSDSPTIVNVSSMRGKLEVNNAGILGITEDVDAAKASAYGGVIITTRQDRRFAQTYELAEECLQINYYGAKRTDESLLPLVQLSDSPTIVNVSSMRGKLEHISNEWAKGILSDAENLTEERIDEVLKEFLKDFREASLENKGWPKDFAAYTLSKAAMNAYTRILAKKCPSFCINSVCPGIVKTDMTLNGDFLPVEEGAASPVRLALLPKGSPSGLFYMRSQVSSF